MAPCTLCRDLQKREDAVRVAFDFLPTEISRQTGCSVCGVIHEAITKMEDGDWQFSEHVSRVYATANGEKDETLTLEVYFKDDRPKSTFELYFDAADGDASGLFSYSTACTRADELISCRNAQLFLGQTAILHLRTPSFS